MSCLSHHHYRSLPGTCILLQSRWLFKFAKQQSSLIWLLLLLPCYWLGRVLCTTRGTLCPACAKSDCICQSRADDLSTRWCTPATAQWLPPVSQGQKVQLQHGVLRTNCIDCLDRTNVAQFACGLTALGQQLHALRLTDTPSVEAQSSAAHELMDMYEDMGNVLSRQVSCR